MHPIQRLGIQSYCFRGVQENIKVAELIKECGLSKVELWGGHGNFNNEANFDKVINTYRDAGVDIVGIGQQTFQGDLATERKWFEFIAKAGAKIITANFAIDSWPQSGHKIEALAEMYDVRIAIHNHGGRHWLGSVQMLRHILKTTSKRIGLCLDTAWAIDAYEAPIAMAKEFANRLYGVHLKDFIYDRARNPEDVIIGQGNLELREFLAVLQDIGFDGPLVLEYEGDVDNPVPALKECVIAVREALS